MRASGGTRVDGEVEVIRLETRFSRAVSYRAHAALVDGLLIDSGFARAREQLFRALRGRPVEQVVYTHAPEDHVGNIARWPATARSSLHVPTRGGAP